MSDEQRGILMPSLVPVTTEAFRETALAQYARKIEEEKRGPAGLWRD
jgi:hypothetical protein